MFLLDTNVVSEPRKARAGKADRNVANVGRRGAALHIPDPRPIRDGLIAATASDYGMTVVTRTITDFAPTGVPLLNR
ncbi:MAG: hypothetical protein ABSC95_14555 [Acetobacteraceae bacterium]|jgi:predicted nucleic acid-binding protein